MTDTETFAAFTPFGRVDVLFDEDAGCTMTGDADAIAHLTDVMGRCTGPMGASITPGNLEPATLVNFCQPSGGLVVVVPPPGWQAEVDEGEAAAPLLDAVDSPTLKKLREAAALLKRAGGAGPTA